MTKKQRYSPSNPFQVHSTPTWKAPPRRINDWAHNARIAQTQALALIQDLSENYHQIPVLEHPWIGILYGRINSDLAATSGIHDAQDVVRLIMAGATVTMIVSVLLRHGVRHLHTIERDLDNWLTEHEYESIAQLRGIMSQQNCPDPSEFERVQYMKTLQTYHPHWSMVVERV